MELGKSTLGTLLVAPLAAMLVIYGLSLPFLAAMPLLERLTDWFTKPQPESAPVWPIFAVLLIPAGLVNVWLDYFFITLLEPFDWFLLIVGTLIWIPLSLVWVEIGAAGKTASITNRDIAVIMVSAPAAHLIGGIYLLTRTAPSPIEELLVAVTTFAIHNPNLIVILCCAGSLIAFGSALLFRPRSKAKAAEMPASASDFTEEKRAGDNSQSQ